MQYLYLGSAILCEVIATSALKAADGFRAPIPTVIVLVGYTAAFYLLSITLRTIPVGIASNEVSWRRLAVGLARAGHCENRERGAAVRLATPRLVGLEARIRHRVEPLIDASLSDAVAARFWHWIGRLGIEGRLPNSDRDRR